MRFNKEKIIDLLKLKPMGQKGWMVSTCPFCGAKDKFGVIFDGLYKGKKVSSYNCFSGKCGKKGGLYTFLKDIGRLDLCDGSVEIHPDELLENKIQSLGKELIDTQTKEISLPMFFKRTYKDEYLMKRGFTEDQLKVLEVGYSKLEPGLKNYVIFIIREEGKVVGWVARSIQDKEFIDKYNTKKKAEGSKIRILRWKNAPRVDFEKLLLGYDEVVVGKTHTVIIVEGATSKANIDRLLGLYEDDQIKCLATFGKKISDIQIEKLLKLKIKSVILLYDPDAIENSKRYSFMINKKIKDVRVGFIKDLDKDPGNINEQEVIEIINKLQSPVEFYTNKLQKRIL